MLRRSLLMGLGAAAATLALSPFTRLSRSVAQSPGSPRFIFVFNYGGWDPTHALATTFGKPNIDMEPTAQLGTAGNIPFVDHAERPSVRAFFERYYEKALVLNGISVPSLAHEVCAALALTGASNGESPDWGTRLAHPARENFTLPHLVLSGLTFPGDLGTTVARVGANAQLEQLLSGSLVTSADQSAGAPDALRERILDEWVARRAGAAAQAGHEGFDAHLMEDLHASLLRARELKDRRLDMDFSPGAGFGAQARSAVDALAMGLSRCVTMANGIGQWDTHADNLPQSGLWEAQFSGLLSLMRLLEDTTGPGGAPLADDTIVAVMSEMGRTPKLNSSGGRDHWPYTSMMLVGPGLTTNRVVGAFDDSYYGLGVDRATGELGDASPAIEHEAIGAALLQLAGVDPYEIFPDVTPLTGILA